MQTNIEAPLTPDEIASLRQVSLGSPRAIPFGNQQRLISLGFVIEASGALSLTDLGRTRITLGK
jgi:hypothetical protein